MPSPMRPWPPFHPVASTTARIRWSRALHPRTPRGQQAAGLISCIGRRRLSVPGMDPINTRRTRAWKPITSRRSCGMGPLWAPDHCLGTLLAGAPRVRLQEPLPGKNRSDLLLAALGCMRNILVSLMRWCRQGEASAPRLEDGRAGGWAAGGLQRQGISYLDKCKDVA